VLSITECTCILVREQRQLFGAEPFYIYGQQYSVVYVDVDETRAGLTPDYESAFIRSLLESSGARVLNALNDDEGAFQKALKRRCGERAREYEVTDSSDVACFFPSLSSEVVATPPRRELQDPVALEAGHLQPIKQPYRRPLRLHVPTLLAGVPSSRIVLAPSGNDAIPKTQV
jgi:hypothetical protein